jgi:integrase
MKTIKFPIVVTRQGVTTKIHQATQIQNGQTYSGFMVVYSLLGKRKRVWRSDLERAEIAAEEACEKISSGQHLSLTLTHIDRLAYLRASEVLSPFGVKLDVAAHEYASAMTLLGGRATITEACRDWIKRNDVALPKVTVAAAVEGLKAQLVADRKSKSWRRQIAGVLDRFAGDMNLQVHEITADIISRWLSGLPLSERSRRNFRDTIGLFNRWLVLRGYLPKGTNWLDGVQKYSARKQGEILIYTPDEMKALLNNADKRMVPFLAIGAFAGLRHAEIGRLDWSEIDMEDGFIEVRSIENTKSDQRRRLVPIKANLKAWLLPHQKPAGSVCQLKGTKDQLRLVAAAARIAWKKNALRHSCISYRVAESGDVPRVSDESGNSVTVIRTNYLRRVKPAVATEWFAIAPEQPEYVLALPKQKAA